MLSWYRDRPPGVDKHHRRSWHADRGKYVVVWRDQYDGVDIQAGYHSLIRIMLADGRQMLDMVWRHKIFRTRGSAQRACEDHANGLDPRAEYKRRKANAMKRPRRKKKLALIQTVLSTLPLPDSVQNLQPKTRKPRSDIGKKRGDQTVEATEPKVRKQRADKGKPRGPQRKVT